MCCHKNLVSIVAMILTSYVVAMGGSANCCSSFLWLSLSRIADSGIDLEKPMPDQKSVGLRASPSGFFNMAGVIKYINSHYKLQNSKGHDSN